MGFLNKIRSLFPIRPLSADECNEIMFTIHPKHPGYEITPEWQAERSDGRLFCEKYNIVSYGGMFYRDGWLFTMTICGKNRDIVRQAFLDRCVTKGLHVDPLTIVIKQQK